MFENIEVFYDYDENVIITIIDRTDIFYFLHEPKSIIQLFETIFKKYVDQFNYANGYHINAGTMKFLIDYYINDGFNYLNYIPRDNSGPIALYEITIDEDKPEIKNITDDYHSIINQMIKDEIIYHERQIELNQSLLPANKRVN